MPAWRESNPRDAGRSRGVGEHRSPPRTRAGPASPAPGDSRRLHQQTQAPARKGAEAIYATGSFWYQAAPMAASLEVLRRIRETDYLERLEALGQRLSSGLAERAEAAGLGFRITGPGQMPLFLFDEDPDLRKGFFWSSAMLARGVYVHPWHNMFLCDAMTEADIDQALDAAEESFAELRKAAPGLAPVAKMAFLSQTR